MKSPSFEDQVESFTRIFGSVQRICPVCRNPMAEEDERCVTAYRIRNDKINKLKYGEQVIGNYLNMAYVCSNICAEKVTKGWDNPNNLPKRVFLLASIAKEIEEFKNKALLAQANTYTPKPKKRKW